jgi:hypothetical protein
MGWLTGYTYRMSAPVANPSTAGDRQFDVPFPAWYLKAVGKVVQSAYQDVHVTKADGTTELPCVVNVAGTAVTVRYDAMPQGRTSLCVYYGNAGASAPSVPEAVVVTTNIDAAFENGTVGQNLSAVWTAGGSPGSRMYDSTAAALAPGSTKCAKVVAPAGGAYYCSETGSAGLTGAGSELTFWIYNANTTQGRYLIDNGCSGAVGSFYITWTSSGNVQVYTGITGVTGYVAGLNTVGNYAAGLMQYRVVFDFTAKRYTLSRRAATTDPWTGLKTAGASDYNIPMFGASTTSYGGTQMYCAANATMYVDDIQAIAPSATAGIVQVYKADREVTGEADAGCRCYVWGEDIDATHIASDAATTAYTDATAHLCGITSAGAKKHYLLKPFEGALPLGTVAEAKLNLYMTPAVAENTELRCHRFKTTTTDLGGHIYAGTVATGWSAQTGVNKYPTWNGRMYDYQYLTARDWATAGAVNAAEIDGSEYVTLALTAATTAGYKTFTLTNAWLSDWALHTKFSQGLLIKDSTDSSSANRYVTIPAPGQTNEPVLEVAYSALDADQYDQRKLSTDTYCYAVFSSHNRFVANPTANSFAVFAWINNDMNFSVAYLSPEGRIHRCVKNTVTGGHRISENGGYGINYDAATGRYWLAAGNATLAAMLAYSDPHVPTGWTWAVAGGGQTMYKGDFDAASDVCHVVAMASNYSLIYYTFTRSTGTWSGVTTLNNAAISGTQRGLAAQITNTDVMAGAGTIQLNGDAAAYPTFGSVYIDTELFWYTGKSGNNLTGVTRAAYHSTAATHAIGAVVRIDHQALTYVAMAEDADRNCIHLCYVTQSNSGASAPVNLSGSKYAYTTVQYLRHDFADAAGTWHDEAGNTLTLPLTQATERRVSRALPTFFSGNYYDAGYLYVALLELTKPADSATTADTEFLNNTDLDNVIAVCNLTTGQWSYETIPDMSSMSFVKVAGAVVAAGLTEDALKTVYSRRGTVWGDLTTSGDYTGLPDAKGTYLWEAGNAFDANLGGITPTYALHQATHGALFLGAVNFAAQALDAGSQGASSASAVVGFLSVVLAASSAATQVSATIGALVTLLASSEARATVEALAVEIVALAAASTSAGSATGAVIPVASAEGHSDGQGAALADFLAVAPLAASVTGASVALAELIAVLAAEAQTQGYASVSALMDGVVPETELQAASEGRADASAVLERLVSLGIVVSAGYGSATAALTAVRALAAESAGETAVRAVIRDTSRVIKRAAGRLSSSKAHPGSLTSTHNRGRCE